MLISSLGYNREVIKYSIVVPFHNEQESVTELYDRLKAVMEQVGETFELVFVDDGSRDATFKLLGQIAAVDSRVVVVKLRRNFGQTSALAAGFDHAQGQFVIAMDGDLQHDPAEIPKFIAKLNEGYDIVSGWREKRIDNLWMRRIPSRCANWAMSKLSGVELHDFGTTYKAYTRELIEDIPLYGEGLHRFIPALASWYGAKICEVPIVNIDRQGGTSHYGISRTIRVFFDLITIRFLLKYMMRPLHFFRRHWNERNRHRAVGCALDGLREDGSQRERDGRPRAATGLWRGNAGRRSADAGAGTSRRVAGAPLPRAALRPTVSRGEGYPQRSGRRKRNSRLKR